MVVVLTCNYGKHLKELIDSCATRCFVSLAVVRSLVLETIKLYTILELGDGQKIDSKGKAINVPVVTADLTLRLDLTITLLLHDVDLILGIN